MSTDINNIEKMNLRTVGEIISPEVLVFNFPFFTGLFSFFWDSELQNKIVFD